MKGICSKCSGVITQTQNFHSPQDCIAYLWVEREQAQAKLEAAERDKALLGRALAKYRESSDQLRADNAELVERLHVSEDCQHRALLALKDALQGCPCSVRERDSGHRIDCFINSIPEEIQEAALAKDSVASSKPSISSEEEVRIMRENEWPGAEGEDSPK